MGLKDLIKLRNNTNNELELFNEWLDVLSKYKNKNIYMGAITDLDDCRWIIRRLIMDDDIDIHLIGMNIAKENQELIKKSVKFDLFFGQLLND